MTARSCTPPTVASCGRSRRPTLTQLCLASSSSIVSKVGWAVGYDGSIVHTVNGGGTWTPQTSGTTEPLFGIACVDVQVCWAVGGTPDDFTPTQVILHTTDGGASWSPQSGDR